jgi:DNA-binding NtrC family response regulator
LEKIVSRRKTILLIDDDPLICEMTQDILDRLGYDSITVASAHEARTAFSANPRLFDLILVDYLLSDESGVELAGDLLRIRPDVPVVLYTGGGAGIEDVRSKGVCAVITKGLTRQEFAETLERIFEAA